MILHPGEVSEKHRGIRSAFKTPTTPDVTTGIAASLRGALDQSGLSQDAISAVMIGTTHFINAVVQADDQNLARIAVFRLCGPYTRENPAFLDFPPVLAHIMNGHVAYLDGGFEYDMREIVPLDEEQVRRECAAVREKGIRDIAVVGVFSPLDVDGKQEARVRDIILEELPDADVVLSRDVGQIGLLERENATILNTSVLKFARQTTRGFRKAVADLGLKCPLFLTQNDGTIIAADAAERLPIKTFNSGPTNSMSGAAYLAGLDMAGSKAPSAQVIVADVGGTTTDVCALLPSGFPREAGTWVNIAGVRSAFPMPDVISVPLGGGTKIEEVDGVLRVGPESVGHRINSEALVFGGKTLTATDIVVAHGKADVGDSSLVSTLPERVLSEARAKIKTILEEAVDAMKLSAGDVLLIMVGGGSIVQMDELDGCCKVIRPPFHDCANAVGAAIARVSGQVDIVKSLEGVDEDTVVEEICEEARQRAIDAGADPAKVKVTSIESLPLQYVQNKAARIMVKAAGPLAPGVILQDSLSTNGVHTNGTAHVNGHNDSTTKKPKTSKVDKKTQDFFVSPSSWTNIREYQPDVDETGRWWISELDCEFIATGSSILACGGGGPGYMCYMACRALIQAGKRPSVVDLDTLPDDEHILGNISYGAPTVTLERTPSGTEGIDATDGVLSMFPNAKQAGQIALEIGGMNAIRPIITGLHYDVPAVDADFMGRAFPRFYLKTPFLYDDYKGTPCTQADGNGNVVTVFKSADVRKTEKIHRKAGQELGLFSQLALPPMTVRFCKKVACLGTMSQAWWIGRAVALAKQEKTGITKAIIEANPSGRVLYTGKIVAIKRYISAGGYTEGLVRLRPIAVDEREFGDDLSSETRDMVLPFQNEFLYASLVGSEKMKAEGGEVVCMTPDLISLVGTDGMALGTQDLRYGVRVSVVAFVGHPHWYTPQGIKAAGPREFGYDMDFKPLGPKYHEPVRVTSEFRRKP